MSSSMRCLSMPLTNILPIQSLSIQKHILYSKKLYHAVHSQYQHKCSPIKGWMLADLHYRKLSGDVVSADIPDTQVMPKSPSEIFLGNDLTVKSPENSKILKVAVIGTANAGKSSLVNRLVQWKVCAVSQKPQTTLTNVRAALIEQNTQVVFVDTPGVTSQAYAKKLKMQRISNDHSCDAIASSDVILVVHDIKSTYLSDHLTADVLRLLCLYPKKPAVLVLNKADQSKGHIYDVKMVSMLTMGVVNGESIVRKRPDRPQEKEQLIRDAVRAAKMKQGVLIEAPPPVESQETAMANRFANIVEDDPYASREVQIKNDISDLSSIDFNDIYSGKVLLNELQIKRFTQIRRGWPNFKDVYVVSAKTGRNVRTLRRTLIELARPGNWIFHPKLITDQTPEQIATNIVREKCLEYLPRRVPYKMSVELKSWHYAEDTGILRLVALCIFERQSHIGIMMGEKGSTIEQITIEVEQELRNTFKTDVEVQICLESEEIRKKNRNKTQE